MGVLERSIFKKRIEETAGACYSLGASESAIMSRPKANLLISEINL